jgi:hypothetical protein
MQSIRRVIAAIDDTGKSVFVSDAQAPAITPPVLAGARLAPGPEDSVSQPDGVHVFIGALQEEERFGSYKIER